MQAIEAIDEKRQSCNKYEYDVGLAQQLESYLAGPLAIHASGKRFANWNIPQNWKLR